jgi:hypothetical protein
MYSGGNLVAIPTIGRRDARLVLGLSEKGSNQHLAPTLRLKHFGNDHQALVEQQVALSSDHLPNLPASQ